MQKNIRDLIHSRSSEYMSVVDPNIGQKQHSPGFIRQSPKVAQYSEGSDELDPEAFEKTLDLFN